MTNILIVEGHTHPELSIANKKISEILRKEFPNAVFENLIKLYPDSIINIEVEMEKVLKADLIVIQTPLFWYSMSSIVMRWFEEVFHYGFNTPAKRGDLANKKIIIGVTAGSPNELYESGKMGVNIDDVMKTIRKDFAYLGMNYLGEIFTGGCANTGAPEDVQRIQARAEEHSKNLIELIKKNI